MDAPRKGGETIDDGLDGDGWVVVRDPMPQANQQKGLEGLDEESRLDLKKRIWQLRICKRKSAAKVAEEVQEEVELDEAAVEIVVQEVERLRSNMSMHWTWFEEELQAGHFDAQLRGRANDSGFDNMLLPPSIDDHGAFPGLSNGLGPKKRSPASSAKSTPQLRPKASPTDSPKVNYAPAERKTMPPVEVWMAAKEHRKTNFFAAAVLGKSPGATGALFSVLGFVEVRDALTLCLTSRGFAGCLLGFAGTDVWVEAQSQDLARKSFWLRKGAGIEGGTGTEQIPFQGDPAFQTATWARHRAFSSRLRRGTARPAVVTAPMAELGGPSTELGPFLPALEATSGSFSSKVPARLLVSDARQSFHIVDVGRRRSEEVEADRFSNRRLQFSLGAHPVSVASSWPLVPGAYCSVAGGIIAALAPPKGAANAEVFQWLELPDFRPTLQSRLEEENVHKGSPASGSAPAPLLAVKGLSSPGAMKPSPSPKMKATAAPRMLPGSNLPPAPAPLRRTTVLQADVVAALSLTQEAPLAVAVEGAWPLPGGKVLLLVRDASSSASAGPVARPTGTPKASPASSPKFVASRAPQAPKALDLPAASLCAGDDASQRLAQAARQGFRWWIQVWAVPADGSVSQDPMALASSPIDSPVTCVDADTLHEEGGESLQLLLGFASGNAELRSASKRHKGLAVVSSWPNQATPGLIRHALLRSGRSAVLAQSGRVFIRGLGRSAAFSAEVLPNEAFAKSLRVASLRPVGSYGFAVCSDAHVYAFEIDEGSKASLSAVVQLPWAALERCPPVRYFEATPYEFFAVLSPFSQDDEEAESSTASRGAVTALWPTSGCKASSASESQKISAKLRGWSRGSKNNLEEMHTAGVFLSNVLFKEHGEAASLDALSLHFGAAGTGGCGLLAFSSAPGVAVVRWGVEANPELDSLRAKRAQLLESKAAERELEAKRRQLQRLRQRLQEIDKLEERSKASGIETLSEDQQAKLRRRTQVQADCERLSSELGEDKFEESDDSEDDEVKPNGPGQAISTQRRREKEKQMKEHHDNRRSLQKERRKDRDRKFAD